MSSQNLHPSLLNLIITTIIFILITSTRISHGTVDEQFVNCNSSFSCGEFSQEIMYPFWGGNRSQECGLPGFELKCQQNDVLTIDIASQTFRIISIDEFNPSFIIARNDLWDDICPIQEYRSTDLTNQATFADGRDIQRLNLYYICPPLPADYDLSERTNYTCDINGSMRTGFFDGGQLFPSNRLPIQECEWNISVPVLGSAIREFRRDSSSMNLQELLNQGFRLEYTINKMACLDCFRSGGLCWSRTNSSITMCLCPEGPREYRCPARGNNLDVGRKIGIAFGAAGFGAIVMFLVFILYQRRQKKESHSPSALISRDISSSYPSSSVRDPAKDSRYFGVRVFSYEELEKATGNFDSGRILGDGGFGTVYKGELQDGRAVAVKRLYENNYRMVEQFMTEVEILACMRHRNLVSLYGCTSRHSRELLLVYEYIPNGTVADHLHGALARPGALCWTTRMNIAVETASALAYLHASDIIHRDVKTNNILLDKNFTVKVADFGLSRLFPNHVTHISTAPQGTPGYVDPEYHQCYHLTDKSDVYSFGVVLIELISSKPAVDITRHRHEINLSNMAINKIQNHTLHELVDQDLGYASDNKVRTLICLVAELAFQCLQPGRDMRPSMQEVLNTLLEIQNQERSKMEVIDIPPDDIVLLKGNGLIHSPDSVMAGWVSRSTTPSTSS